MKVLFYIIDSVGENIFCMEFVFSAQVFQILRGCHKIEGGTNFKIG